MDDDKSGEWREINSLAQLVRRIDRAVADFDPGRPETLQEVRAAVRERVGFRREQADPPEKVLAATKAALLAALRRRPVKLDRDLARRLIDSTTRWFLATYYGESDAADQSA